jgi:hypothetical protein
MGAKPQSFKESEIRRTVRGLRAAGLEVDTIEVCRDGVKIRPKPASTKPETAPIENSNEWAD